MSPKELEEYTDNDILELIQFKRGERQRHHADMKVQAWDIFLAVSRIMSDESVSFDDIFPDSPVLLTDEELAAEAAAKGTKQPD